MNTYQLSEKHKLSITNASKKALETKVTCQHCKNDILKSSIAKHENSCYENPTNLNHCKTCNERISHKKLFCNKSCAATFNGKAFPKRLAVQKSSYKCLSCNKENELKHSTKGLYCNNKCQGKHLWETVTKSRILKGERITTKTIRKFLIERDGPACSSCNHSEWLGKPLVMDVDHIDGDHRNNTPENFRLLCPNCHRQTPTWGKKNSVRYGKTSLRYSPKK